MGRIAKICLICWKQRRYLLCRSNKTLLFNNFIAIVFYAAVLSLIAQCKIKAHATVNRRFMLLFPFLFNYQGLISISLASFPVASLKLFSNISAYMLLSLYK